MANNIIKRVWNQNKMVNIEDLSGSAFQAESGGHTFQISGIDDTGASVALSGTVAGVFRRADNADIALTGSASEGVVSVTLTDDCYAVPGRFGFTIFVTSGGQKTAVYAAVGTVSATSGGGVAGETPQDVADLINAINAAVASIPADYTDLIAAIASTYSSSALYPVGSYAWYDGHLYRCTTPITTAETWTAEHWQASVISDDVASLEHSLETNETALKVSTGVMPVGLEFGRRRQATSGNTIAKTTKEYDNTLLCCKFPCSQGDVVTIKGAGDSGLYRLYCFANSNDVSLDLSDSNLPDDEYTVTAPAGTAYCVVNVKSSSSSPYVYVGKFIDIAAIAPTYSTTALYPVGSYVWHDGHLYRCTIPITTAETWTAAHWTAAVFGDDIGDLKSALRAKEVNTWNMWDGSWGLSKPNPVTNATTSYLVYGPIIPVTAGTYYSIGIVDNPLYSDLVKVIGINWYDANNTRLSVIPVYPQGGYLKWMQAPSGAVKAVPYYNTNDATVPLSVEQVKAGGYKWFFAARLINFTNRDSVGKYAINANEWIPSYLWDDNSIERTRTTIVTVGATNSNFTSLRDAIDTINSYGGASETNRFEVRIKEGTYDISSYYTSAEKAQSGFVGLTVPDWVTLKGVGNREKTILQYVLTDASNKICVLNLQNTCSLENLTLYGVKTRYCVHDDKANYIGTPYKRFCKNVHFKGDTMTLGTVYGAGINSNAEWIFEDCIFESLTETNYQNCFSVHGSGQQVQVGSSSILFDNCRFIGHGSSLNNALILSTLMNNASYFQNYCNLKGCSANGRLILREENASTYGAGIAWWATGFATTFTDEIISNTDGVDYSDHIDII